MAGLLTSHNRLTYNNPTPHPRPAHTGATTMAATASHTRTASPVLDFDLITAEHNVRWTVFRCGDGAGIAHGRAANREAATVAAIGAIADRTPGRVYALKAEGSWCIRGSGLWAPLPLTPAATEADVFSYCNDTIARGRSVEVVNVARLARHFA